MDQESNLPVRVGEEYNLEITEAGRVPEQMELPEVVGSSYL